MDTIFQALEFQDSVLSVTLKVLMKASELEMMLHQVTFTLVNITSCFTCSATSPSCSLMFPYVGQLSVQSCYFLIASAAPQLHVSACSPSCSGSKPMPGPNVLEHSLQSSEVQ